MTETELVTRLERLERDNRRLKRLATVALVIAAAFGAIYAAQPVPDKITAHEFDVVDSAGRVRIKLAVDYWKSDQHNAPVVKLYDSNGSEREELGGPYGPGLLILDDHQNPVVNLSDFDGPGLLMRSPGSNAPFTKLFTPQGTSSVFIGTRFIGTAGPSILLRDPQGFSMELGSTSLVTPKTGATQNTSAASIVMSGKDYVIWKAP